MIIRKKQTRLVYCNQCGQVINGDGKHTDYLEVNKAWGYFSEKDLKIHSFDLCETCYDQMIRGFKIPIDIKNNNEAI